MITENTVLREDDPRVDEFGRQGWRILARSWGAQLDASDIDREQLGRLVERVRGVGDMRELNPTDLSEILALDGATTEDYPGGVATAHTPLDRERATVGPNRRGFGVVNPGGRVLAMTFIDLDGSKAETEFTVVASQWRGNGLGAAVKAASVLALLEDGVEHFRTGGSADNPASLAANSKVGYTVDEVWLTLAPPAP